MFYRETGQIKTDYKSDMAIFPIAQDRWFIYACIAAAVVFLPMFATEYVIEAFLIREGLIDRSDDGRELTAKGLQHLQKLSDEES